MQPGEETVEQEAQRRAVRARVASAAFALAGLATWLRMGLATDPSLDLGSRFGPAAALWLAAAYEAATAAWITRTVGRAPLLTAYLNAAVEQTVPLLLFLVVSSYRHPAEALSGPALLLPPALTALTVVDARPMLSLFSGLYAAAGYLVLVEMASARVLVFDAAPIALPEVYLVRALVLAGVGGAVAAAVSMQRRSGASSGVVVAAERDVPGEKRTVAVMSVDLRGMARLSERQSADDSVALLNRFLAKTFDAVKRGGGLVCGVAGGGFLAVFGAPRPDPYAAASAVETARELVRLHPTLDLPCEISIGIDFGTALCGPMGPDTHREYTALGHVVQLATHLQALNKQKSTRLLVSHRVVELLGPDHGLVEVGQITPKGSREPIRLYTHPEAMAIESD